MLSELNSGKGKPTYQVYSQLSSCCKYKSGSIDTILEHALQKKLLLSVISGEIKSSIVSKRERTLSKVKE